MRSTIRTTIASLVAGLTLVAGASVATAQESSASDVPAGVEITDEVQRYLDTLDPVERAEFIESKLPAETEMTAGSQVPANDAAVRSLKAAQSDGSTVTPLATGCWTQRWTGKAKATFGNVLYTWYHVGYWCASGTKVTKADTRDAGGETSTPGWRYEGIMREGHGVVSNQGRSYTQHKFVLGAGGIDVQSPTECLRVNGKYNATATGQYICGIY